MGGGVAIFPRIARGLGANAFGQVVQLAIRVFEIPLFLYFLGAKTYGEWLLIAALPAFLSFTDGGVTKAVAREMAMQEGQNDSGAALRTFRAGWLLLLGLSIVVLTIVILTTAVIPVHESLKLHAVSAEQFRWIAIILTTQVILSFNCWLLYGALASGGFYAAGTWGIGVSQLLSFAGTVVALSASSSLLGVAIGGCVGWFVGLVVIALQLRVKLRRLSLGIAGITKTDFVRLLRPSVANLAFPVGEALNIYGTRVLIGMALGPTALATFTSLRTLCRVALQPIVSVARTFEPEFSMAHGAGNIKRMRLLFAAGTKLSIALSAAAGAAIAAGGKLIYLYWTHGQLRFDGAVFLLLLGASIVGSTWTVALSVASATNRHTKIAAVFALVYGGGCIGLATVAIKYFGMSGVAASLLISEALMAWIAVVTAARLTDQSVKSVFASVKGSGTIKALRAA